MERVVLIAALLLLVLRAPAEAAQSLPAATCAPSPKPIVLDFATQTPDPIHNHNLNVAGIRNLFRLRGQTLGGPHDRALSVTAVETLLSLSGSSTLFPVRNGYCLYMNSVTAKFGWRRLEAFVASDFAPESCEYRAVLDHENQHVAINRGSVAEFAPIVCAELEKALREQPPVFFADPNGAADAVLKQIHQRLDADRPDADHHERAQ